MATHWIGAPGGYHRAVAERVGRYGKIVTMPIDIILIVLVLLVFVGLPLIQIRKQNKRLQQVRDFQEQLGPGMVVKTTSGLHGRVAHVGETTVDLEIAKGVVTTWEKISILETVDAVEPGSQQETQLTDRHVEKSDNHTDD